MKKVFSNPSVKFVNLEPNDIVCDSLHQDEEEGLFQSGVEAQGKRQSMWDRE
jgi:hypothetical protein